MTPFYLEVLTPEKTFFAGEAEMIVFETLDGQVGVMAQHEPSVYAIQPGILRITSEGKTREAFLSSGFCEVRPDETVVLSQAVEWPEEIDEKQAEAAARRAEDHLKHIGSLREYRVSKAALARAFARLSVKSRNQKQ